ncbi:MAG: molybdopterin molybdenumtransferase MoeA, partial [Sphingopyxis sp.]
MSGWLPVEEAQARLLALRPPLLPENVDCSKAFGRYLSDNVVATRDQPAAALSAMDGYAIRFDDLPGPWAIAGSIPAGAAPAEALAHGQAMRIFTGALLPDGADTVVIQEDVAADGAILRLTGDGPATRG